MAKFEFALEGVLRHRRHVEDECQRALAGLQQQVREAEGELRQLDQAMRASQADMRENRLVGRIDLGFLAAYRRHVAAVQRKGTNIAQRLAVIQRQVDAARAALGEASKQRKIVEKLRERQFERWKLEQSRREAAELDEVTTRLSAWRMSQNAAGESVQ